MAHELTQQKSGKYEFAYIQRDGVAWHGLGQALPAAATPEEILEAAGLKWQVLRSPIYIADDRQVGLGAPITYEPIAGSVANVRSDTREVLGIVSDNYKTFQNGDGLRFMGTVVGEADGAIFHTAGSIRQGRKVFACARLPEHLYATPEDVIDQYLLLVNNHDGDGGLHLRWTTVRVVCANTLTAALAGAPRYEFSIRHVGDLDNAVETARKALGVGRRYFAAAGVIYQALSARQLSGAEFGGFLDHFMPIPVVDAVSSEGAVRERDRALAAPQAIAVLYDQGLGTELPGVRGTAWGAVNAAVEWAERVRPARQDGDARKGAGEVTTFGWAGQELRDRAFAAGQALLS